MYEDLQLIDAKTRRAFRKVKADFRRVSDKFDEQTEAIKRMYENQKKLLIRIKTLEDNQKTRLVIAPSKPKVITKTKVVEKVVRAKKTYVGAKSSMKLHDEDCPFAKNIKRANKVLFKSKVKPFGLGYKACACLK